MVFDACQGRVLVFCHVGGNENCSGVMLIVVTLSFGPYGGTTIRMWSGKSRRCCNFFDSTFVGVFVLFLFFIFLSWRTTPLLL